MSPATFYLINHTTKEYCIFENSISIIKSIETTIKLYENWSLIDDIRVDFQLSNQTDVISHLENNLKFRDLDFYVD
jgi:hypothetical protein